MEHSLKYANVTRYQWTGILIKNALLKKYFPRINHHPLSFPKMDLSKSTIIVPISEVLPFEIGCTQENEPSAARSGGTIASSPDRPKQDPMLGSAEHNTDPRETYLVADAGRFSRETDGRIPWRIRSEPPFCDVAGSRSPSGTLRVMHFASLT